MKREPSQGETSCNFQQGISLSSSSTHTHAREQVDCPVGHSMAWHGMSLPYQGRVGQIEHHEHDYYCPGMHGVIEPIDQHFNLLAMIPPLRPEPWLPSTIQNPASPLPMLASKYRVVVSSAISSSPCHDKQPANFRYRSQPSIRNSLPTHASLARKAH